MQGCLLHSSCSEEDPEQSFPLWAGAGSSQSRFLSLVPPPQGLSQSLHAPHWPHIPCTITQVIQKHYKRGDCCKIIRRWHKINRRSFVTRTLLLIARISFFPISRAFCSTMIWLRIITLSFMGLFTTTASFGACCPCCPASPLAVDYNVKNLKEMCMFKFELMGIFTA